MMRSPVWWLLGVVTVGALAVLIYWVASALWVKIISDRWNAMCRQEDRKQ